LEKAVIVNLPETTVSKISKELVSIREQGGAVALGRVLTLVIEIDEAGAEEAIAAANEASREHPSRIITLISETDAPSPRLDAEIRVGGDAGASEVIVLRAKGEAATYPQSLVMGLLLPDAPVVAWWPNKAPAIVSQSPIGKIATRRITDSWSQEDPSAFLSMLAESYSPGDSDFAWTRLTLWRAQFAALLDQAPHTPIESIEIVGDQKNPSVQLLASWFSQKLRCPVSLEHREDTAGVRAIYSVRFNRESSNIEILRNQSNIAVLTQSGQPPKELSLPVRSLRDCLAEDMRRLDPDLAFGKVIQNFTPSGSVD
jgi:glucose-6-phosphate dehydrogenase assembly protein OpcA